MSVNRRPDGGQFYNLERHEAYWRGVAAGFGVGFVAGVLVVTISACVGLVVQACR